MTIEQAFSNRRSIYALGSKKILTETQITDIIAHALKYAPSAFNSQSSRLAVLYGKSYQKLWDITLRALSKVTPPEKFPQTVTKINAFKQGLGTILFFEDQKVIEKLQKKYPLYAETFPKWAEQGNAMLQYMIWLALSEHKIGASLQHYNPLIDEDIHRIFKISKNWYLTAQMPFGSIADEPQPKNFAPLNDRLKIFD